MSEEYHTTKELSKRIKYAEQTIYNWVCQGKLKRGVHYVKPTKRKLLFKWSAMQAWIEQGYESEQTDIPGDEDWEVTQGRAKVIAMPKCRINI